MPSLLKANTSKQELLDLQDYPPDGDVGVDSQSHSPIGSAPRSPSSLGADASAPSAVFTGATSFQGQFCELGHSLMEQDSELLCGWGSLRPKAIQVFNTPRWVLFFLSVASFLQGLIINGFVNTVVTSIERRFDLSSSQTGLIVSSYDIACCVCLPFVSYFGGNGHKPRLLGWGIMIMGLGSLVFSLPHFTTPSYQVTVPEKSDLCSANSTAPSENKVADQGLSNYFYIFVLGQLLHGIGATPLFTLGVTFLDENAEENNVPVFMGVFYTATLLGPSIGMLFGGYLLSIYSETTLNTEITTESPLWVGAWWIGFILAGTLCLPVGFVILGYPIKLPGVQETTAVCEAPQDKQDPHSSASEPPFGTTLKDMPKSLLLLCSNPTFMFLCLAGTQSSGHVAAMSAFMIKFFESQFRLSSSEAAMLFGIIAIPATGGGTFFGSYFVKRFKLHIKGIIRFCITLTLMGLVLTLIFFIHCPNVPLAGVTVPYPLNQLEEPVLEKGRIYSHLQQSNSSSLGDRLTAQCNSNCSCDKQRFSPVCGADDVMYFSPCYAGCASINITPRAKAYADCSCVLANVSWGHEGSAVAGQCRGSCPLAPVFLTFFTVLVLVACLCHIPPITAVLRCVPARQKSFALGIQWIFARTLGAIPGPIVFGFLIDKTCLLRQNEDQGSCLLYENSLMSHFILIASVIYKTVGVIFYILALMFHRRSPQAPDVEPENAHCGAAHATSTNPPEDGATVKRQTRI